MTEPSEHVAEMFRGANNGTTSRSGELHVDSCYSDKMLPLTVKMENLIIICKVF